MTLESLVITIIILAAGVTLITTAWRLRLRYRVPCLDDYFLYILFFYLMTFANQVLPTAVWGTTWWERGVFDPTFWALQALLGLPLAVATLYFFLRFLMGLSGRAAPRIFTPAFRAGSAVLIALISVYIFGFFRPEKIRATVRLFDGIRFLVVLSLAAAPAIAAVRSRAIREPGRARIVRGFAFVQAVSLVVFEAAVLAHPPELIHDILRFLFNIPPFLFLARRISTIIPPAYAGPAIGRDATACLDRYGISPREREIVRQVCQGRTNREIEETLFISLDTVKRHLTHIFRKCGIRNRAELVALLYGPGTGPEASGADRKTSPGDGSGWSNGT